MRTATTCHWSKDVLRTHLTGDVHVGLYPLVDGDLC